MCPRSRILSVTLDVYAECSPYSRWRAALYIRGDNPRWNMASSLMNPAHWNVESNMRADPYCTAPGVQQSEHRSLQKPPLQRGRLIGSKSKPQSGHFPLRETRWSVCCAFWGSKGRLQSFGNLVGLVQKGGHPWEISGRPCGRTPAPPTLSTPSLPPASLSPPPSNKKIPLPPSLPPPCACR